MLKQLIGRADQAGRSANLTWEQLNTFMNNMGVGEFDYDTFKMAYDADPIIQALVDRFDQRGISLATKKSKPAASTSDGQAGGSSVSQAAKRATAKARSR